MARVRKRLAFEVAAFVVVVALMAVFAARWRRGSERHAEYRFMMGTVVSVTVLEPDASKAAEAIEAAFAAVARVESLTTRRTAGSDVGRLNAGPGGDQPVSHDVALVAARSLAVSAASSGAFDITVAPLVDLWGIGSDEFNVPASDDISRALHKVDWRSVGVDTSRNLLLLAPGAALDLDGVAKGYAVDRAVAALSARGIATAVVDAGGDVGFLGTPPDASGWRVGIKHPRGEGLLGVVTLDGGSIATSGDYQRFVMVDSVRYHHILDPSTGYPARGVVSVSVASRRCIDADALATAVFVMGPEAGMALVETMPGVEAVIVTGGRNVNDVFVSSGLSGRFQRRM